MAQPLKAVGKVECLKSQRRGEMSLYRRGGKNGSLSDRGIHAGPSLWSGSPLLKRGSGLANSSFGTSVVKSQEWGSSEM